MIESIVKEHYDEIIKDYLQHYDKIDLQQMSTMVEHLCWQSSIKEGFNCKHFKIVNQQLYICGNERYKDWESRIEAFKYMVLETLKDYKIQDCEFVMYDDDGINEANYSKCLCNNKPLPLIVTTSVLDKYQMILVPDFTFSFIPEYAIKNNEQMCREVVEYQERIDFKQKNSQMVWRGSTSGYRSHYLKKDDHYNIESVHNQTTVRGQCGTMYRHSNSLTPKEKSMFKYQLQLNGHLGSTHNGAYSSAFKWTLMGKSVVFYSAPAFYREFWMHPSIFKENEHYIYTQSVEELDEKYRYYRDHEEEAEKIAIASFDFFKKYLLDYSNIKYYVQKLFNEYAKKLTYTVTLKDTDQLIKTIKPCDYLI